MGLRAVRFWTAIAMATLLLSGCGGDEGTTEEETPEATTSPTAEATAAATPTAGASPTAQEGQYRVSLSGRNEVPPAESAMDGSGTVALNQDEGTACPSIDVQAPADGEITGAHIHRGAAGENGPIVVRFQNDARSVKDDCVTAEQQVLSEIAQNPAGFYVNVHTNRFPNGATRGQLEAAGSS